MRWPFGPAHLTLKPSKNKKKQNKTKQSKKQPPKKAKQNRNRNKSIQPQNKTKQTNRNKTNTKKKTKEKKHKNTQTFQTQINKKKPPQQSTKNWEKKQALLTLLELLQTHKKQTTITLKPQKTNPKKHLFAMFKKNRLFFINFLFFSSYSFCF